MYEYLSFKKKENQIGRIERTEQLGQIFINFFNIIIDFLLCNYIKYIFAKECRFHQRNKKINLFRI